MDATEPRSFRNNVRGGFAWLVGLMIFRDVMQFGLMLVLTRLLSPAAYGQFGVVTAILTFANVFSFRSFLEHTLQVRGVEPDYQTHFTMGVAFQASLTAFMNLLALALARTTRFAPVAPLLHAMSALFLLEWMSELRVRMLEWRLDWRRLRMLQACGLCLYSSAALSLAVSGAGVWSLLLPSLLVTLPMIYDLLVREGWRPDWTFNAATYMAAKRWGLARIGSGAAQTGRPLIENTLFAQMAGFAALGFFGRATGLAQLACLRIPTLLTTALFPVLTRLEPNTDRYRRAADLVLCAAAWAVVPVASILALLAAPVIQIVYGARWLPAAPLLPLTLASAGLAALTQVSSTLLLGNLQPRVCAINDLLMLSGTAASLFLLLPIGPAAYLSGVICVNTASLLLALFWLRRTGAISLAGIRHALQMPAASVLAAFLLMKWLPPLAGAALTVILAAPLLRLLSPGPLSEVLHFCPGTGRLRRLLWLPA